MVKVKPRKMGRPRKKARERKKAVRGQFIGMRIPDDLKKRLETVGDKEGKSTTDLLRELITKHVETREALYVSDLELDDDPDNEPDDDRDNGGPPPTPEQAAAIIARNRAIIGQQAVKRPRETPAEQVSFEVLLDDIIRYTARLKELDALMAAEKGGWFGSVPAHLAVAKTVCEKKLKLIAEQMKALFPDAAESDAGTDDIDPEEKPEDSEKKKRERKYSETFEKVL